MSLMDKMLGKTAEATPAKSGNAMLDALLGMLGVTPEQLSQIQEMGTKAGEVVGNLQTQLNRIEEKQDRLLKRLEYLYPDDIFPDVERLEHVGSCNGDSRAADYGKPGS